ELGDMDIVVRILEGHGGHFPQLGADQPKEVLLLLALRLGNHDDAAIAAGLGNEGEAHAGIARGALDRHGPWTQHATPLRDQDGDAGSGAGGPVGLGPARAQSGPTMSIAPISPLAGRPAAAAFPPSGPAPAETRAADSRPARSGARP